MTSRPVGQEGHCFLVVCTCKELGRLDFCFVLFGILFTALRVSEGPLLFSINF